MWGKLPERNNRPNTRMISEPQEPYRLLATPGIEVGTLLFCSDYVVWASWTFTEEEQAPILRHTNDVLGSYVTAGARLRLYSYLDKLQERALYCDTDSVLYVQITDEQPLITCADNLGDIVSELGPSEYIQEFVSGGPKNYAYKIINKTTGNTRLYVK
jgi:hypothetical protein